MELQDALTAVADRIIPESEWWAGWNEYLTIVEAARRVANGKPVVRMRGLSPAYYITDDPTEADAWLIEVKPKEL